MAQVLGAAELLEGFRYPRQFLRDVKLGLVDLEPWWILRWDLLRARQAGLQTRYPARTLVPLARRQDNDDVAALTWMQARSSLSTSTTSLRRAGNSEQSLTTFFGWLRHAIDDFVEFDVDQ